MQTKGCADVKAIQFSVKALLRCFWPLNTLCKLSKYECEANWRRWKLNGSRNLISIVKRADEREMFNERRAQKARQKCNYRDGWEECTISQTFRNVAKKPSSRNSIVEASQRSCTGHDQENKLLKSERFMVVVVCDVLAKNPVGMLDNAMLFVPVDECIQHISGWIHVEA